MISNKQEVISTDTRSYRKLIAWEKSDELAYLVYRVTIDFPKEEVFGMVSQLRRASLSVPANIIEGYSRMNKNEFRRFLSIALGSLAETGYFIDFGFRQGFISDNDFNKLISLKEECGRIIWKLYQSQK